MAGATLDDLAPIAVRRTRCRSDELTARGLAPARRGCCSRPDWTLEVTVGLVRFIHADANSPVTGEPFAVSEPQRQQPVATHAAPNMPSLQRILCTILKIVPLGAYLRSAAEV